MTSRGRGGNKRKLQDYSHSRHPNGDSFLICNNNIGRARERKCILSFLSFYYCDSVSSFGKCEIFLENDYFYRVSFFILLQRKFDRAFSYFPLSCYFIPKATYNETKNCFTIVQYSFFTANITSDFVYYH